MTKTSDLPRDNTLSRVPLTCLKPVKPACKNLCNSFKNLNLDKPAALKRPVRSTCKNLCNSFKTLNLDKPVRSTCKDWYKSFKNLNLGARKQFLGFVTIRSMVFSMVFDLQGIRNNDDDFVDPSIKLLSNVKMSHVFRCGGLLLCVTKDHSRLLVWNPYLNQRTWFKPINNSTKTLARKFYRKSYKYTLGYDTNNHIHKIFRLYLKEGGRAIEIYDFNSNSWKVLDLAVDHTLWWNECEVVSLKGNTYFLAGEIAVENYLLCLDFTTERFGPRLPLPFHSTDDDFDILNLSSVRVEQLAMLHQHFVSQMIEIWVTTNIEPNNISWSKFLKVDMKPRAVDGFPKNLDVGNFFIDEEKKVLVVFNAYGYKATEIAYIVGEDGYFKSMNVEEAPKVRKPNESGEHSYADRDFKLSSYVPSLVQLQINE